MSTTAPATAPAGAGGKPGSRLRGRLARVSRDAWLGWAGVALGLIAFYITLPPILVRSLIPSLLIAVAGLACGVVAVRAGEKRVGWGAVVACLAGAFGAYGAVESGVTNLERVVVWSALLAAALRYATPLTFAALGGVTSERSGVVNIGLEGMMLTGAFFGAWGADVTSTWVGGILIGLIAGAALSIFLFRTPQGLRLRSVGENPLAADTAGISPIKVRYWAVIASGAFAALGGVFLSIGFVHSFSQNMTVGKGFIGLAVVIVGKWKPGGALAAALLFGFSSALAQRLPVFSPTTATLLQALPYVLTLIAVAGLVGRSRPPAADGIPYERHSRRVPRRSARDDAR